MVGSGRGYAGIVRDLVCLAGAGALFLSQSLADVNAGVVGCRSDPIVTLSNGVVVQMFSDIADSGTHINNVAYVLHAPLGVRVVSVTYPPDTNPNIHESLQFFADGKQHKYYNTATVFSALSSVTVVTYSTAVGKTGKTRSATRIGKANQTLAMTLNVK